VTLLLNNDVVTSARENTENWCVSSYLQFIWNSMQSDISTVMTARDNIYGSCVKFRFSFYLTLYEPPNPGLPYPRQIYKRLNFCGNKMPTRCKRGIYCRFYYLLNMFRALLCPSSGAQVYNTVVAACGILCCGFQVAGLVWS
jgi:hypothetical protein